MRNRQQGYLCAGILMASLLGALIIVFPGQAANYSRPNEPPVKPAFIPLDISQVRPAGWAREWALRTRDVAIQAQTYPFGDKLWIAGSSGSWTAEAEMYYIEGITKLGYLLDDSQIKELALAYVQAALNRGVSTAHVAPNPGAEWEDYFSNHFGYSALAYYFAAKDNKVITAYNNVFKPKSLTPVLLKDSWGVFPNSTIHEWRKRYCVEVCTEMFSLGADSALLKYAKKQWTEMDPVILPYFQQKKEFTSLWEHGFSIESFLQNYLIGYLWTGKQEYLEVATGIHEFMETNNRQPSGASTSGEWFNGTGGFKKSEICGMVPNLPANAWFLRALGDARYGDRLEKNFFNSCLNALDERHFGRYFSTPNIVRASLDGKFYNYPEQRMPGYGINAGATVKCCAGSMFRILVNYMQSAWMATYDNGLAATLFAPCTLRALAGNNVSVTIAEETNYPFDETVKLTITPASSVSFPLYVRIPGWCTSPSISVAGSAVSAAPDAKGFVKISRTWNPGDIVLITFPMKPRVVLDREIECLKPDSFSLGGGKGCTREDEKCYLTYEKRNPYAAVYLGPVLYGIRGDQQGGAYPEWRYAFHAESPGNPAAGVTVGQSVKTPLRWPMNPSFKPLSLKLMRFDWQANAGSEWNCDHFCNSPNLNVLIPPAVPVDNSKLETVELVPMGATQYHVSMFPVTTTAVGVKGPDFSHRSLQERAHAYIVRRGSNYRIRFNRPLSTGSAALYTQDGRLARTIDCSGKSSVDIARPSEQVYVLKVNTEGRRQVYRLFP